MKMNNETFIIGTIQIYNSQYSLIPITNNEETPLANGFYFLFFFYYYYCGTIGSPGLSSAGLVGLNG